VRGPCSEDPISPVSLYLEAGVGRWRGERLGRYTSKREEQIKPMKLLLCAIRTASFTDIERRPLLSIMPDSMEALAFRPVPRSLHRRTGSGHTSVNIFQSTFDFTEGVVQFGCFQFNAVQMSGLNEVNTIERTKSGLFSLDILAWSNASLRMASA